MALRYLARRVGMPALRQASGSRVTPSAGCGPLASRSSQARYSNRDAGWKQESEDILDRLVKSRAIRAEAEANAAMRANRMKKIERRMYMGSAATAFILAWYTVVAVCRELDLMLKERDLELQVMQMMEGEDMLCEEDMEEGENE